MYKCSINYLMRVRDKQSHLKEVLTGRDRCTPHPIGVSGPEAAPCLLDLEAVRSVDGRFARHR